MSSDKYLLSPGVVITIWRLIYLINRYENLSVSAAIEIIKNSNHFGGTIPANDTLKIAQSYSILEIKSQVICLTDYCRDNILILCKDEEPNVAVIRALLSQIISNNNFHWLIFFCDDSDIFKSAIPQIWIDLLESAGLFEFEDADVLNFWGNILQKYENYVEGQKKKIGDVGEKLTLDYEVTRLTEDEIPNPKYYVKWASKFSDKYGYDILSIRGSRLKDKYLKNEKIQIEVKSSVLKDVSNFRFIVTKNEWETAQNNPNTYLFYCWLGVDIKCEKAKSGPYAIKYKSISNLFPSDVSQLCEWTECRFIIDLVRFGEDMSF